MKKKSKKNFLKKVQYSASISNKYDILKKTKMLIKVFESK